MKQNFVWNMPGTDLKHSWNMPGTCLEHAWNTPGTSLEHAWNMPGTCQEHAVLVNISKTPQVLEDFPLVRVALTLICHPNTQSASICRSVFLPCL